MSKLVGNITYIERDTHRYTCTHTGTHTNKCREREMGGCGRKSERGRERKDKRYSTVLSVTE